MGNQQLLLIIMVTISIALATIIAMNIFGVSTTISNRNAVKQDLFAATNMAQTLHFKNEFLGGAGGNFTRIEESIMISLMIPGKMNGGNQWENENGVYKVEDIEKQSLKIRGKPSTGEPDIVALVLLDTDSNSWFVSIADDE